MHTADLLVDAFGRIHEAVGEVLDGLDEAQLTWRADPGANSIAWLVWHLTRIEDDHLAAGFGTDQVWLTDGWAERLGLPFDPRAHGYGHSSEDVAAVRTSADLLAGYHDAVHVRTVELVRGVSDSDLDRVVDTRWTPPVTLGVRLVSVIADGLQHVGQAAFVRGVLERR
jgi:hypothetical protein